LPTSPPAFPLKAGTTGRYLVDRDGRPFLIVGDSPQALIANVSETQADRFFANREAAGFNSVWINLLCDPYTAGRPDGETYDGIAPFRKPGDLSTPNPAYFARVGDMIRLAATHRLAVFLDPIETGGWLEVLRRNGIAKDYAYGRYLGRLYRRYTNIVWLNGNDFQTWRRRADDALVLAVARGIRSEDPDQLQTIELNYLTSTSLEDQRWKGIVGLNAAYTYAPTYAEVMKAYGRRPDVPVFMVEANYEGEHWYTGPETLRRQEYWTMLSGATGQFYGNKYTWQFLPGWPLYVTTIGSRQMTFVSNLFAHRRWFDLVPDSEHRLVVSGYGTYSDSGEVNSNNYVAAARTPDGKLAIAYLPSGRPIEVDMTRVAGPRVRAQWYDPTSGRYTTIPGSPFVRSDMHRFTVPGKNHARDEDWVLVLTSTATTRRTSTSGTACLQIPGPLGNGYENPLPSNNYPAFSALDGCGFPSPDTAGVSGALTPVDQASLPANVTWYGPRHELAVTGPATISNISILDGHLAISTGAPVKFNNDLIRCNACNAGSPIVNNEGYTGVTIEHSTIGGTGGGSDCTSPSSEDVGSAGMVLNYDVLDCSVEPVNGSGYTLTNSYVIVDGYLSDSHNEDVYQPGGGSNTIEHNTLLDPLSATAEIFMDSKNGSMGTTLVENNLVAGAGYGDGAIAGGGGSVTVSGNVFSDAYGQGNPGRVCSNTIRSHNTADGTGAPVRIPGTGYSC
jgi:hypothetical protein